MPNPQLAQSTLPHSQANPREIGSSQEKAPPPKNKGASKIEIRERMLKRRASIQAYARAGMTTVEVAEALSLTQSTVRDHWPSGIPYGTEKHMPEYTKQAQALYQRGVSPRKISEMLGVSLKKIYHVTSRKAFQQRGLVRKDQPQNQPKIQNRKKTREPNTKS